MNANKVLKGIVSGSLLAPDSEWYATVQKAEDVHRMEYSGLISLPQVSFIDHIHFASSELCALVSSPSLLLTLLTAPFSSLLPSLA